jgi:hypothetical protein
MSLALVLIASLVLILVVAPAAGQAWARPHAPASAQSCSSDFIDEDTGGDWVLSSDTIWTEAQIRSDGCSDLRAVGIFENDFGCNTLGAPWSCNDAWAKIQLWDSTLGSLAYDSGWTQLWTYGQNGGAPPKGWNDVYYSVGRGYVSNWPTRGHCYYAAAHVEAKNGSGTWHYSDEYSQSICI